MEKSNERLALRVSAVTLTANVVLSVFKLFAGLLGSSSAMLSDAVHTLSDVLSTVIVMVGVKLSGKQSDKDHPYGHERFECVAAILLSAMLASVGAMIGWGGVKAISAGDVAELKIPSILALCAAAVSIIIKEAMYWYTRAAAKKTGSGALMADAWHHRSDAMSSVGSLVGITGARMGFPVLDPLASVIICLFILKVSVDIFREAVKKMTDRSCDDDVVEEIRAAALSIDSVLGVDQIKTRLFGDRAFVDIEICLDGGVTLSAAHGTAQLVHDEIEAKIPKIKHCMVHVNPAEKPAEDDC